MSNKLTLRYNGDIYVVSYSPGWAGNYLNPPESPELEILKLNGEDFDPESLTEQELEDLENDLINAAEDKLAAEQEDFSPPDDFEDDIY